MHRDTIPHSGNLFYFSFFLFAFQSVLFSLKCTSNWAMKRFPIVMESLCLNLKMGFSQPCASHEKIKCTLTGGRQNNVSTLWRRTLGLKWLDHNNSHGSRGGLEQVKCQWAAFFSCDRHLAIRTLTWNFKAHQLTGLQKADAKNLQKYIFYVKKTVSKIWMKLITFTFLSCGRNFYPKFSV